MALSSRAWFRIIIDLVHDITGGAWIGGGLVLWAVRSGAGAIVPPDVLDTLVRSWGWVLTALFGALVLQVATGLVRVNYKDIAVAPEARAAKGRAALVKHAVFAILFVLGAVAAFSALQP